jgi:uncharacterized protein YfiM (DUF2279 family)
MTRIIAIIAMCLPMLAHAWTDTQKALYLSAQAATVIDWAQTRHIAKSPDKFQEVNPLIGKNPSTDKVDAFMAGRMVANHLIAHNISEEWRTPVLVGINIAYWGAVIHNDRIGVKMDHADKVKHLGVSAAIGAGVKSLGFSGAGAFGLALVPGVLKELHDSKRGTGWSNRDMAANAIGAAVGIYSRNWFVKQEGHQTVIGFTKEF